MATTQTVETYEGGRLLNNVALVRETVLKYRGRCLHVLGKQTGNSWTIDAYNPSFHPDIPPGMLNRAPHRKSDEQPLLAYNNAAGEWQRGGTGLVITDQAVHVAVADWALAPDPPKGRIARLLKSPPVMNYRIELQDLERVGSPGGFMGALAGGLVINNTYNIPMDTTPSPWTGEGWTPDQLLRAVLTDLMELRLPPSARTPKDEAWLSGQKAHIQPQFPFKCVVCLAEPEAVVLMDVPSTQVRLPGYGREYGWIAKTFEPGVPYCKQHKPWGGRVHDGKGSGIEAYYLADFAWRETGLRDLLEGLKLQTVSDAMASKVSPQSLCLKFKNREYMALFCEANGITPG